MLRPVNAWRQVVRPFVIEHESRPLQSQSRCDSIRVAQYLRGTSVRTTRWSGRERCARTTHRLARMTYTKGAMTVRFSVVDWK